MTEVFVVRNQLGHYWGKAREWVDGTEPKAVMRAKHEDEAINTLFELSSKDTELRGEVVGVELSEKGEVIVKPSEHLLPKKADIDAEAQNSDQPDPAQAEPEQSQSEQSQPEQSEPATTKPEQSQAL